MVAVLGVAGCAGDATRPEDTEGAEDAIVSGKVERGSTYDAAVSIYDRDNRATHCSGVFIAPRVVVTAEHCLQDYTPSGLEVRRGEDAARPRKIYRIKNFEKVTAEGTQSTTGWGADVAFLVLEKPATDVVPVQMLDRSLDQRDLGQQVLLVAYGQTSNKVNDSVGRLRRSAPGVITAVSGRPHAGALVPGTVPPASGPFLRAGYEAQVEDLEQGFGCSGDSGGPHLATIDGQLTVMALSSGQSTKNGRCTPSFTIVSSFGPEVQAAKARALAAQ